MWINCISDGRKKVRSGTINHIAPLSKQLVHKSYLFTGISNNLNGANYHMIQSETDIVMIFSDEDDDEMFERFTAKDLTAATEDINKQLMDPILLLNCL